MVARSIRLVTTTEYKSFHLLLYGDALESIEWAVCTSGKEISMLKGTVDTGFSATYPPIQTSSLSKEGLASFNKYIFASPNTVSIQKMSS